MLTFEELKRRKDIISRIDWEMTPQKAFEDYQLKSIDAWKKRSLPETFYFCIYVFQGESKVVLVKRSLKQSEEIAEIPAPPELVAACLERQGGDSPPHGHYAIDEALRVWLWNELGL